LIACSQPDHLVETRLARIEKVLGPIGFGIERAPADIAGTNLIEMTVGPAHGRLDGQVQAVEADVERHLDAAQNRRPREPSRKSGKVWFSDWAADRPPHSRSKPWQRASRRDCRVAAIPTSETTAALARQFGVPLTSFAKHRRIDVTIDGADQVERGTLNLIKGLGGALLREKIVASASDRMIVLVEETKLVDRLGRSTPLPVETVSFGWQTTLDHLSALGYEPRLRMAGDNPFTTDNGNYIIDCIIAEIPDPAALEARLSAIIGLAESGLFIGLASKIVVGRPNGVEVIER
jgi:ribose 5-phosphate isomerase A